MPQRGTRSPTRPAGLNPSRAISLLVLGALIVGACGQDRSPSVPTEFTFTDPEATIPAAFTDLGVDIDLDLVYAGLCLAWSFEVGRDHGSINDAIASFLRERSGEGRRFTDEQLNDAVRAGCDEGSPAEGIVTALQSLALDSPDLASKIDSACVRYADSVAGRAGAQDFDQHVSSLLDMNHAELTDLVVDICGTEPFDAYEDPPDVLPRPDLTPGSVDDAFDVEAACASPIAPPPIPAGLESAIFETYDVDPSDFEVQRLIPFELGGTTTADNLFPIPLEAHPGASDKPLVDNLVIELVCNGSVTVGTARSSMISNWPISYASIK